MEVLLTKNYNPAITITILQLQLQSCTGLNQPDSGSISLRVGHYIIYIYYIVVYICKELYVYNVYNTTHLY